MDIVQEAKKVHEDVIRLRREIHQNPELSFKERDTAKLVAETLEQLDVPFQSGCGGHGLVARFDTPGAQRTIAFRGDMDALPITEETGLPFASKNLGVMHACGHDIHTAMLMGTAMLLKRCADKLTVNVRLVFQPAEERPPGGAVAMMRDGLADEGIDEIYGIHVFPLLGTGQFISRPGPFFAAPDTFKITIVGKGGHAAAPHNNIDPVPIAAEVVTALQTIASRTARPCDPMVLSVSTIHGGTVFNVTPDTVEMTGTVRTFSAELKETVPARMHQICDAVTRAHGASYELNYESGYMPLINDAGCVEKARAASAEIFGEDSFDANVEPMMFGEDFAHYLQTIPGAFIMLGVGGDKPADAAMLHTPRFIPDEEAFYRGPALFANIALRA